MYMNVLLLCIHVHHVHTLCLQRPKEGTGVPEPRVTDSYELPCGYQESNLDPL